MLDTYTIDIEEFIEKYESVNEKEKVILNIQKFINSINDNNYNYAYNCLADSFKNNYFSNVEDFKNYIENNFGNNIDISYIEFDTVAEKYYTYRVNISNRIQKTFIVQLGEGTDFKLSFDI